MSRDNLKPLTQTEWEAFTPKQKWDVIVALRGPDVAGSETIKWFTTSVIRGRMRQVMRVGGQVNTDLNLIILPSSWSVSGSVPRPRPPRNPADEWGRSFHNHIDHSPCAFCDYISALMEWEASQRRWESHHFLTHSWEAAEILSIPVLTIDPSSWSEGMGKGYKRAISFFLERAEKTAIPEHVIELKRHLEVMEKGYFPE